MFTSSPLSENREKKSEPKPPYDPNPENEDPEKI
jgi:hypothetical protein